MITVESLSVKIHSFIHERRARSQAPRSFIKNSAKSLSKQFKLLKRSLLPSCDAAASFAALSFLTLPRVRPSQSLSHFESSQKLLTNYKMQELWLMLV
jgi:hypothetical protein